MASLGSCIIAFALAFAGPASAQVTIGQLAPTSPVSGECGGGANGSFYWQYLLGEGPSYEVPAPGGVLTSWSTRAAGGAGQFLTLKVLRPLGGGSFDVVGTDGPRALAPGVVDTTVTDLPVQAGDTIAMYEGSALESAEISCRFSTGNGEDDPGFSFASPAGPVEVEGINLGWRVNLSATVLLPPTVESLATTAGPLTGGTSVTIAGKEFEEVTAVDFGDTPAASFTVDSEGQITAVSPPGEAGSVPVTVTTIAGTSAPGAHFTYQPPPTEPAKSGTDPGGTTGSTASGTTAGPTSNAKPPTRSSPAPSCKVPKLAGKKLSAAKKKLTTAHCKVGAVTKKKDVTTKTGTVV
ncbi:MAG TPA: IPT/TIG domain-containing protein, partial [Solirubrobacterales bacterium]|nr:IPT/TIG domain-containing protein [Solirubrobacterales bacterium]